MSTWADVIAIGATLPEVVESTSYGTPALKVRKKMLCRMRSDPDALVVRTIDLEDRDALLRQDPGVFFTTPHYEGYPYVLVRLETVPKRLLAELLEDAWRTRAPKTLVTAYDDGG
jgi:hypothetical protein